MGKKVNPISFRIGSFYDWTSHWFGGSNKIYSGLLYEDVKIRRALMLKLRPAGITKIDIGRSINQVTLTVFVARPGMVIGRGGTGLEDLKKFIVTDLLKLKGDSKQKVELKVETVKEPNLNAQFVGQNVADQIIKRLPAKRILASTIEKVMTAGALGVRVRLGGRINGAEIARVQHSQAGVLPLSTMRANIDYASVPALTRSGYVGVKVWIHKKNA
ncbi:MAG: 30S ribosomal protein S3 [Patescibacteria group bacterium]